MRPSTRLPFSARTLLAVATSVAVLAAGSAVATAQTPASGPTLAVPASALAASLHCAGDPKEGPAPVLLVPGTTLTPDVNFDWNYELAFTAAGRAWCAVTLPNHAMTDIQVAAEYVVYGIRTLANSAGRRISVVGFSQGGMVPRWALKFWPDTRSDVDDLASLDPSNHGTLDAYPACAVGGCAPAIWQQQSGSRFLAALNRGPETYAGISYTQVYTATDEVVVPNFPPAASSALHTGDGRISNVLVQSICPVHVSEHLSMGTSDPVGYALVMDALDHVGPADATRVPSSVCTAPFAPEVDPVTAVPNLARVTTQAASQLALAPHVAAEPPLAPYASAASSS